jgi:hypothetical protein
MDKAAPGEDGMVLRNPVDPASYMGSLVGRWGVPWCHMGYLRCRKDETW